MKINMFKFIPGVILKQYTIVVIANFTLMHLGLSVGWMSPVLVKLTNANETVLAEPITESEGAWIVSIGNLFLVTAMPFTGLLANNLGRKTTMVLGCLPRIAMCFLFIFASSVWMLLLARCLSCISDLVAISVSVTYSSEIASKEVRGALGTLTQILSALGAMIMLSVGPFVSYVSLNIILTCIVIATFIPILFLPESPYFLHSKGRTEEALKVLTFLRGSKTKAQEEINEYAKSDVVKFSIKEVLTDKVLLKTFGLTIVLTIGVQLIGYNAISFYLQTILILSNTSVSPEISSVVIGCIELFACFCTILLTDRFGRKPIIGTSLMGMALGLVGLGTFFTLTEDSTEILGFLNYLPLMSIILVVFCFNSGMGSLLWILIAELFDGKFRAFGLSTGVCVTSIFVFLTLRFFPSISASIGLASTYWTFSGFCVVYCVFILFYVPETKGRTFGEIQQSLRRINLEK